MAPRIIAFAAASLVKSGSNTHGARASAIAIASVIIRAALAGSILGSNGRRSVSMSNEIAIRHSLYFLVVGGRPRRLGAGTGAGFSTGDGLGSGGLSASTQPRAR